jgi:hypothetical protein
VSVTQGFSLWSCKTNKNNKQQQTQQTLVFVLLLFAEFLFYISMLCSFICSFIFGEYKENRKENQHNQKTKTEQPQNPKIREKQQQKQKTKLLAGLPQRLCTWAFHRCSDALHRDSEQSLCGDSFVVPTRESLFGAHTKGLCRVSAQSI